LRYAQQFSSSLSSSSSRSWSRFCGKRATATVAVVDQILDLSRSPTGKIGFWTQTRSYLSTSLPTHHANGVDIAYLYLLPFFLLFSLFTYFSIPFQQCLGVPSSLISVFVFLFPFSPKKLLCVLSLKSLVVVGTGRVVGEGVVAVVVVVLYWRGYLIHFLPTFPLVFPAPPGSSN